MIALELFHPEIRISTGGLAVVAVVLLLVAVLAYLMGFLHGRHVGLNLPMIVPQAGLNGRAWPRPEAISLVATLVALVIIIGCLWFVATSGPALELKPAAPETHPATPERPPWRPRKGDE